MSKRKEIPGKADDLSPPLHLSGQELADWWRNQLIIEDLSGIPKHPDHLEKICP